MRALRKNFARLGQTLSGYTAKMTFCALASGSSGNAAYIGFGGKHFLVDAGLSGKRIVSALGKIGVDRLHGIFVTHEHIDHIAGVGVLARRFGLDVFATPLTWRHLIRHDKIGPISAGQKKAIEPGQAIHIGDAKILAFGVPHDASDAVGYSFMRNGVKIAIATDLGQKTETVINEMKGSRLILLESNHDPEMLKKGRYPQELKKRVAGGRGHLSNAAAGMLLAEVVVPNYTYVYLAHLSEENNTPMLAHDTVGRILDANGVKPAGLAIADRYVPGEKVEL